MHETPAALLEAKLAAEPNSPLYVKLGFLYLEEGKVEEALRVALEGREKFPRYATGHLLVGKCLSAMGDILGAVLEYRKALRALPDNPALRVLVSDAEVRRLSEFRHFAEAKRKTILAEKSPRSFDDFVSGAAARPSAAAHMKETAKAPAEPEKRRDPSKGIVTPTLAEIYASQGEYLEAIAAYKRLLEYRPGDAARFGARVEELEELARRQQAEKGGNEGPGG
jgi:tetratricopeptide (TPR) repeat protein